MDGLTKNKTAKGFLNGVSVLTISALAVKVIGLLYRIPMLAYLGTEGMGYFNTAYELYALFCVIATAGLPVAMSVLISSSEADPQKGREVGRIFRVSLAAFIVIGTAGMLLLYGFSDALAALFKNSGAAAGMRMIAPTVLLICLSSAFRGYFQGKRSMTPTAVSQVIEALGKLLLGLTFASMAQRRGCDLPATAAYAVLGLTVGTGISVVYLWIHKILFDRRQPLTPKLPRDRNADVDTLGRLLMTAIPVTFGAAVMSVTKVVDLALILRRLQAVGLDEASANTLYGCYSTLVLPLFHMLPTLTTSVSLPTVPALSAALGQKTDEGLAHAKKITLSALRLTLMIAIPAAIGLSVFSEDVLTLLFGTQPEAVKMATPWLTCIALSVPMSCLLTVSGAILQGSEHAARPVISLVCGTAVKTVLAYILLGMPEVGMMGAPISTLVCDSVIVIVNFTFIARLIPGLLPLGKEFVGLVIFPLVTGGGAVALVWLLRRWLGWQEISSVHTLGTVTVVMCLYGAVVLGEMMLKGRKRT
ncbi:MAG: polysaccharide biosynthesis protein [Clostridia bacterium]|nr:polysaccharide biosynthesis protein [Clostridia bacterium]